MAVLNDIIQTAGVISGTAISSFLLGHLLLSFVTKTDNNKVRVLFEKMAVAVGTIALVLLCTMHFFEHTL